MFFFSSFVLHLVHCRIFVSIAHLVLAVQLAVYVVFRD